MTDRATAKQETIQQIQQVYATRRLEAEALLQSIKLQLTEAR